MYYNQKLPLNNYVARIETINWLKPDKNLDKNRVEEIVKTICDAFGIEAELELRNSLEIAEPHCDSVWDSATMTAKTTINRIVKNIVWGNIVYFVRDTVGNIAWEAIRRFIWNIVLKTIQDIVKKADWDSPTIDPLLHYAQDTIQQIFIDAANNAAWGAADLLAQNIPSYKEKYPNGNFIHLIDLWEMGLYPVGVIDGKFVVYIPQN